MNIKKKSGEQPDGSWVIDDSLLEKLWEQSIKK